MTTSWNNTLCYLGFFTSLTLGGSVQVKEVCSSVPHGSVRLDCAHPGRIHLVRVLYRKASRGCLTQDDTCEYLQETEKHGLTTSCAGVSVCLQAISSFWLTHKCGNTTSYTAAAYYHCIDDSIADICSSSTASSNEDMTLYLASSNYPYESRNTYNTCQCDVTGTSMNVTILELFFRHRDGIRANITLRGDNSIWQSFSHSYFVYNTPVMENVSRLALTFQTYGQQGQHVWLKVRGVSSLTATCSGGTGPTSQRPTRSDPSTPPIHKQDNTILILTVVSAVGAVVLILVVVAVVVWCIARRRRKAYEIEADDTYTYYDNEIDHVMDPSIEPGECDVGRTGSDICSNNVRYSGNRTGRNTNVNNNISTTNIYDHLDGGHMYIRGNTAC
ncbi:uncharacterized protein LOC124260435 isoform X2 [Haliotis rubra]|uniref:uncharacterized protein LOC124260435 isoform X2 n=1 Tax=Haliotis rubra TaxID=36100 RepID=UPI001EE54BA3|nr:uncharacterized protein LOC124260435 isoform X2 [Haliotis rubra]